MSYDIQLVDPCTRETLEMDEPHQLRGGTYQMGGTQRLWLNVTYNYYQHFRRVLPPRKARPDESFADTDSGLVVGIRTIYGMTGAESILVLDAAIAQLGDDVDDDYWKATEGNAKRALLGLRALATMRPDGVWDGD